MIGARQPSGHHFLMLVSQHGEDLKTMMAEPAGVIVYDGSLSYYVPVSMLGKDFLPLTSD